MPGVVVRLAGVTFNSTPDEDGDEFYCSDLQGWDGGAVNLARVERPLTDGAFVVYGRRLAWTLTLSGWVIAGDEGIGQARRKLSTAIYGLLDTPGTLEVDEDDGTYSISGIRLESDLRTRQQGPQAITFEVTLLAGTPTKTLVPGS